MAPKFVYVASPYTKGDVAENVRTNVLACDELAEAGFVPFCPLLTHLWHLISPHSIDFWYNYDLEWLTKCDAIIRLPGESAGADREVAAAQCLGLPVFHSVADFVRGNR